MLTHTLMAILGAALAAGLLLAFYNPASSAPLPGSDAVPAPGASAAPLTGGEQVIVTKVKPGLVIINTMLQYDSEAAAGTGMVIDAGGLVLTNNHVIEGRAGQLRHPGHRDDLREPGSLGRPDRRSGHYGGERTGCRLT